MSNISDRLMQISIENINQMCCKNDSHNYIHALCCRYFYWFQTLIEPGANLDGELPNALETEQFLLVLNEFSVSYAFQISKNVNAYHKMSLYAVGDHQIRY